MEAFSMDLRQRIWDALNQRGETGDTLEEIAKRFQVSRQWLFNFRERLAHDQTLDPKPHGGGQPRKVTEEVEQCLCDRIREHPDVTLQELRDHCGIKGSIMVVWRVLKRLGISRKKKRSTPKSGNPRKSRPNAKSG
jgi:transposase